MIEEINKEIKTENSVWNPYFDMIPARINYISTDRVCEILDKYKEKECDYKKYKTMWEELYSEKEKPCSLEYMQDLEEKYKIGVE